MSPEQLAFWTWARGEDVPRKPRNEEGRAARAPDVRRAERPRAEAVNPPGRARRLRGERADGTPRPETPPSLLVIKGVRKVEKIYKPN